MTEFANAMEVFKLLDKSNCRKCNEKTCLAFASRVFLGERSLEDCPSLPREAIQKYGGYHKKKMNSDEYRQSLIRDFKDRIKTLDLAEAARRTGGVYESGRLTLRIFGKPFSIDRDADMTTDIHINPWIVAPVLGYVLECRGVPLTGNWVPFRELKGGREKNGLFVQRSEKAMKKVADHYPHLFEDLIVIFNGKQVENRYESDISLVLYPLPRLPLLICYWKPEEAMESQLNLFFDSSADENADIDIVYGIAAGIVNMFEKIALKHGHD